MWNIRMGRTGIKLFGFTSGNNSKKNGLFIRSIKKLLIKEKPDITPRLTLPDFADVVPKAVVGISAEGQISLWNKHAQELFGWSEKEVLGKNLHELIIPEEYRALHLAGMKRLASTGQSRIVNKAIDLEALNKKGELIPIELTIIQVDIKVKTAFVGFISENSEKLKIKKELKEGFIKTEILSKLMEVITETNDTDQILKSSLEIIGDKSHWPIGHVLKASGPDKYESTGLWYNNTNCPIDEFKESSKEIDCEESFLLIGRASLHKEISWIEDVQNVDDLMRKKICKLYGLRGIVCFPLIINDDVEYLLEFFSLTEIALLPAELKFFDEVSSYISGAISMINELET